LLFTIVGCWLQAIGIHLKLRNLFGLPNKWGAKVGIVKLNRKFEAKQVFQSNKPNPNLAIFKTRIDQDSVQKH